MVKADLPPRRIRVSKGTFYDWLKKGTQSPRNANTSKIRKPLLDRRGRCDEDHDLEIHTSTTETAQRPPDNEAIHVRRRAAESTTRFKDSDTSDVQTLRLQMEYNWS